MRLVKSQTQDRSGSGFTDAGKCQHIIKAGRKTSSVLALNDLRRAMKISGASVIAQSSPVMKNRINASPGQGADIGKPF